MKLNRYLDFLTESKLDFLLEAKMDYSPLFKEILSKVKSQIAKDVLSLNNKEVDVNTNYIDINLEKDSDVITFIPDNRVKPEDMKNGYVSDPGNAYTSNSALYKYAGLNIQYTESPKSLEEVTIVREFSPEEMSKEISQRHGNPILWVKSKINGNDYFIGSTGVRKAPLNIKSNDIKIGRFVRRLLDKAGIKDISDKDIEDFVNQFKAKVQVRKDALSRFKIVNGEDIRKWYHEDNYAKKSTGTLGGSCMRHDGCQKYFDIYVQNPEQVSLIVLMDENIEDKICGRAILWKGNIKEDDSKEGVRFMDRIYTINSADETLFQEFAIKSGFYYKERQDNDEDMVIMFNNEPVGGKINDNIFEVSLSKGGRYKYWPYMDTLKFYSISGTISNENDDYDFRLEDTDGGNGECNTCGGQGRHECNRCNGNGEEECNECDGRGQIRCDECSGEGHYDCGECEGTGEINCDTCDGSGKDDEDNDCSNCGGKGKQECSCDGGTIKCENCDGDGENECSDCDGRGEIECYDCDGRGTVDCEDC